MNADTQMILAELAKIVPHMRGESLFALTTFLQSASAGMGGTLVLHAAHKRSKREVPEAAFRTEGFNL